MSTGEISPYMGCKTKKLPIYAKDNSFCAVKIANREKETETRRETGLMTRQENLIYRKQCPYDAMGDYSVLMENEKKHKSRKKCQESDPGIRRKIK